MSNFKHIVTWIETHYWAFIVGLFLLTRLFIVFFPTTEYSDVTHYYERYANFWRYGMEPYFEHLYEYPPASVPVLYLPLELDQRGWGKYYLNYRVETFLIESLLFVAMFFTVKKFWPRQEVKRKSLLVYIGLSLLASDWLYEGIDLTFTTTIFLSYLSILWLEPKKFASKVVFWTLFWLSTSIKFLTLPLMVPLYLLTKTDFKKDLVAVLIGFLLIWGGPILYFRSALSVSFIYNAGRPLKYSSFPSYMVQVANVFTESEIQSTLAPDFEFIGPVSNNVSQIVKILYPLSILYVLALSALMAWKNQHPDEELRYTPAGLIRLCKWIFQPTNLAPDDRFYLMLRTHALYLFVTFFTAKIFSQPYHLWYLPLIALYPFDRRIWPKIIAAIALMYILDLTSWLAYPLWFRHWLANQGVGFEPNVIRDIFRYIPMLGALTYFLTRTPAPALHKS
ncbi:MAG TPA: hypothetical protein VF209_03550 [Patescibacteria group bacterium]